MNNQSEKNVQLFEAIQEAIFEVYKDPEIDNITVPPIDIIDACTMSISIALSGINDADFQSSILDIVSKINAWRIPVSGN